MQPTVCCRRSLSYFAFHIYIVVNAFAFPETFKWINIHTNEINTVPEILEKLCDCAVALENPYTERGKKIVATESENHASQLQNTNLFVPETHAAKVNGDPALSSNTENSSKKYLSSLSSRGNFVVGRKRPPSIKAAKEVKCARLEAESQDNTIKSALDSWTKGLADASAASILAGNDFNKESRSLA